MNLLMPTDLPVSWPLAFLAGVVSFLSPCVLPLVPSYVAYVSGFTLEELEAADAGRARRAAALHALVFGVGFGVVFMTLGAAATAAGQALNRALPWIHRLGGILIAGLGLYLMGLLRIPALGRERRVHLGRRPEGFVGSFLAGVVFGAGWTPCIGPILASILVYAGLEATMLQAMALLAVYGLGLAIPFLVAAIGFNWLLTGIERIRRWVVPLERAAGAVLVLMGILMVSGTFASLTAYLAGLGQLFQLEM